MKPWRSRDWTQAGKGEPCTIWPCGNLTTDFAHIRLAGFCGTQQKPPDVMGIDVCREHHDAYGNMQDDPADVLAALCRTLIRRIEMGFFE